jgi:secreted trypsin-like serine protease
VDCSDSVPKSTRPEIEAEEETMRKAWIAVLIALVVVLATAVSALAITFGEPDGGRHPNVGAMIVLEPDGIYYLYCSGTLISPTVFLTAAHCTDAAAYYGAKPEDVSVTFNDEYIGGPGEHAGTYYLNPNYGHDAHDAHDVAVIVLDEPILDIPLATLPPAGLLDEMKAAHTLKGQQFVTVGYGALRNVKTRGPHSVAEGGTRWMANQTFQALKPYWLQNSMNPSTGSGGTCYGDSGGPHFLGETSMVVSVTVTGDRWCRATDVTYRLDTDSARAYLEEFVDLP